VCPNGPGWRNWVWPEQPANQVKNDYYCNVIAHERDASKVMHSHHDLKLQVGDGVAVVTSIPLLNRLVTDNQ
jgi:hypothetical protein